MPYELYKVLHLAGVMLAFTALGGQLFYVLNGGDKPSATGRGLLAATHGLGVVLLLVAGFGMHAKLQIQGFPGWFLAKLVLWLLLAAFLALPWRLPHLAKPLWGVALALGVAAAWLGVYKPF